MRINYLLGLPTFLMIIGLAWASQSHAEWDQAYNELDTDFDLPEVESLLSPEDSPRSSFDLVPAGKHQASVPDQSVLELVKQFDALQHEVQELRGRVETQDHELKLLKKQPSNSVQATSIQKSAPENPSLNSNSGLELNNSGITYKPAGT